jgi:hypothetical protein
MNSQLSQRTDTDMQFDLQALIGFDEGPINPGINFEPVANQPISSASFNWAVPNDSQVMEGMANFDNFLMGYLNDQPTTTNPLSNIIWDEMGVGAT